MQSYELQENTLITFCINSFFKHQTNIFEPRNCNTPIVGSAMEFRCDHAHYSNSKTGCSDFSHSRLNGTTFHPK